MSVGGLDKQVESFVSDKMIGSDFTVAHDFTI